MSSTHSPHLHLAVAFQGTGRHLASWREPVARPRDRIGSPETIARTVNEYVQADASDGFILVPHISPTGLDAFVGEVVPLLQEQGVFRTEYGGPTLRHHFGLAHPDDVQDEQRVVS